MTEDTELPEREASITNEQPDLAGDGDQGNDGDDQGDDDGGGSSFGLTKRQGIILGVIGAAVLLYLLKRRSGDSGSRRPQTLDEARDEDMTPQVDVEDEDETVEIPQDSANPLAADAAVTEMMRESGRIGSGD